MSWLVAMMESAAEAKNCEGGNVPSKQGIKLDKICEEQRENACSI
jgi:hypothetical protein